MINWLQDIVAKFYEVIIVILCVLLLFCASWIFIDSIRIRTLKNDNTQIESQYHTQKALCEAKQVTIDTDKKTVERLQSSCQDQIKSAVDKIEKAVPVCPDGKQPIYKAKGLIK